MKNVSVEGYLDILPNAASKDFEFWQLTTWAGIHKRNNDSQASPGAQRER